MHHQTRHHGQTLHQVRMWMPIEHYLEARCRKWAVGTDIWWDNYLVTGCWGFTYTLLPLVQHQTKCDGQTLQQVRMWVPFEYYLEAQCQFLAVSTDIWWVNYLVTGCQGVTNTLLPPLHHQTRYDEQTLHRVSMWMLLEHFLEARCHNWAVGTDIWFGGRTILWLAANGFHLHIIAPAAPSN